VPFRHKIEALARILATADAAIELASVLLAMAVGDDGLHGQAEQETYETTVEKSRGAKAARETRQGEATRYRISVGHKDKIKPGGIVAAITSEDDLHGSDIGKIDIFPSFSLVHITADLSRDQVDRISRVRVADRPLRMAIDKGAPPTSGPRVPRDRKGGWARTTNKSRSLPHFR